MPVWLCLYVLGTLPLAFVFAAGLSGWFFDYPLALVTMLFLLFTAPVVCLFFKLAAAPTLNIAGLWTGVVLLTARIIWGIVTGDIPDDPAMLMMLAGFAVGPAIWAAIWTVYFRRYNGDRRDRPEFE